MFAAKSESERSLFYLITWWVFPRFSLRRFYGGSSKSDSFPFCFSVTWEELTWSSQPVFHGKWDMNSTTNSPWWSTLGRAVVNLLDLIRNRLILYLVLHRGRRWNNQFRSISLEIKDAFATDIWDFKKSALVSKWKMHFSFPNGRGVAESNPFSSANIEISF